MNKRQEVLLKKIKESGLTKSWIAEKLEISSPHLSMMLSGNANMPEEVRNKINSIIHQAMKISI